MTIPSNVKPILDARFVALIDKAGNVVDATNPVPVGITAATVTITNAFLDVINDANPIAPGIEASSIIAAGTTDGAFPAPGPNATAKPIKIGRGTAAQSVSVTPDTDGTAFPISAATLPLPTGAATEATVSAINGKLASLGQKTSAGSVPVVIASDNTVAVSAASLPLPTGAATAALQTTGNSSLSSIDTKTPALASGRVPVDGSGVTQPVSAATLPLPTGASTAAKQPALGTAGTPSADVLTVQGAASMTALKVDGSAVTQPVSAASLPLPTGASTSANQTTLGSQTTKINDGTNTAAVKAASAAAGAADPSAVVALSPNSPVPAGTNLMGKVGLDQTTPGTTNAVSIAQLGATAVAAGTGTQTAGTLRVVLATDQAQLTNALKVDGSAVTQPVSVASTISVSVATQNQTENQQLDTLISMMRTNAWVNAQQIQVQLAIAANGFFPLELPAFLS